MVLPVQRSIARLAAAPVCVVTLGSRGTKLLPTMCKGPPPQKKTLQLSTKSSQTMKEFWFFNFSSSLICCLRNSILWRRNKATLISVDARMCMCFAHAYLCSRSVAWISQTLTKERRFLSSVQFSDKQMLPIVWASSRSLDACVIGTLWTLDDVMKKYVTNTAAKTPFCGTDLFFYVFRGPTLHVSDEILVEVRREGRGERAGGPRCRGSGGSRGWTGSTVDAGWDVVGAGGGTPLTAVINTV